MMRWQWHQLNHMQAICTSLQKITPPAPHQWDFYGPDALPDTQTTVSKHWRPCKLCTVVWLSLYRMVYWELMKRLAAEWHTLPAVSGQHQRMVLFHCSQQVPRTHLQLCPSLSLLYQWTHSYVTISATALVKRRLSCSSYSVLHLWNPDLGFMGYLDSDTLCKGRRRIHRIQISMVTDVNVNKHMTIQNVSMYNQSKLKYLICAKFIKTLPLSTRN